MNKTLKNPEGEQVFRLGDDESCVLNLEDFETGDRTLDLTVYLEGSRAECHIKGRICSKAKERKVWNVKQVFSGSNQVGTIDLRGTAQDESFLSFDGRAHLKNESSEADVNVEEKIMLFDQASGRSLPVLRVETDQVKSAGHGASIAPIDREKLLYFQSRGIAPKVAGEMLKEGFLR